jgi:uncharacterized membrane protein YphA (DoxX/SURF4 family)
LSTAAGIVLGAVLLVSGVTKLASPERWSDQARELLAIPAVARVLPVVEVVLGALLIVGWHRRLTAVAVAMLLIAFTVLLVVRIGQGRRPPCACFGTWSSAPIGWSHVARNAGLLVLAMVAMV